MIPPTSPKPTLVGPLLQAFFTEHLCTHKRVSLQTIASYRDSFRLLLQFLHSRTGTAPAALRISDLDAPAILSFLEDLEGSRGNSIRSRNARLTAIRSFFRLVALRDPASVVIATRVLAIPVKRTDKRLVGHLSRSEMDAILAAPDRTQWIGRRDHALLLTMYNSGARVSEVAGLKRSQVHFGARTFIELDGKECHSYCISFRRRNETTIIHACRQACDLAFSSADVLLVFRTGIGLGPYTDTR
jgi:integrase/recombinase XerD